MNNRERDETLKILDDVIAQVTAMTKGMGMDNGEAWTTFTGLPFGVIRSLFVWAVEFNIDPKDLLLTVAAVAYVHGGGATNDMVKASAIHTGEIV
jgi:hypothetical protein